MADSGTWGFRTSTLSSLPGILGIFNLSDLDGILAKPSRFLPAWANVAIGSSASDEASSAVLSPNSSSSSNSSSLSSSSSSSSSFSSSSKSSSSFFGKTSSSSSPSSICIPTFSIFSSSSSFSSGVSSSEVPTTASSSEAYTPLSNCSSSSGSISDFDTAAVATGSFFATATLREVELARPLPASTSNPASRAMAATTESGVINEARFLLCSVIALNWAKCSSELKALAFFGRIKITSSEGVDCTISNNSSSESPFKTLTILVAPICAM